MRVLLVDDNTDSLQSLAVVLEDLGHDPVPVRDAETALKTVKQERFPLIISDIRMPGMDGMELLTRLRASRHAIASDIVLITGHGDRDTAVAALRNGAYDYLSKPINARELAAVVERSAEHQALLSENQTWRSEFHGRVEDVAHTLRQQLSLNGDGVAPTPGGNRIVAEAPAMVALLRECLVYHEDPDVPVLLEGETGVGKELIARLIHHGPENVEKPFIAINCAAIPPELFEAELLGHDPGAYTGSARQGAPGKLELAGAGTLFLDEIAEMPQALQPKLLRVLESRSYYRVGGSKPREFKARVICAANRSIAGLVQAGLFRRDLYHRLKVGHLVIPPLRERPQDIEQLAMHFLMRQAARKKKRFRDIHPTTRELLLSHPWPGNVRELENVIERAVLTSDAETLLPGHIYFLFQGDEFSRHATESPALQEAPPSAVPGGLDLERLELPETALDLDALNQTIIQKALEKFEGNKTRAAAYLGMSRYALHRRLQK